MPSAKLLNIDRGGHMPIIPTDHSVLVERAIAEGRLMSGRFVVLSPPVNQ